MKLRAVVVSATIVLGCAPVALAAPADGGRIALPKGFQPEGIVGGPGGDLFVGSVSTGAVVRVDPDTGRRRTLKSGFTRYPATGLRFAGPHTVLAAGGPSGSLRYVPVDKRGINATFVLKDDGKPRFLNDIAVVGRTAYVTDSRRAQLEVFRVPPKRRESYFRGHVKTLALSGIEIETGNNLNGIVALPGGRTLLSVQSNTGKLWRIDVRSGKATQVDTGGYALTNGDGMILRNSKLLVSQNRDNKIAVLRLTDGGRKAALESTITSPDLDVPSTIAFVRGRLYAVNARFGTPAPDTADYWIARLAR